MRNLEFGVGEYYHIFNRGNDRQIIFRSEKDYIRFLSLILFLQFENADSKPSRLFIRLQNYLEGKANQDHLTRKLGRKEVELIAFALMPNHFHLLIREVTEAGISCFLQRVQMAYSKYFNAKYKRSGHLFQGTFKAVHVKDNDQLLYLSAYIHRNPRELKGWRDREHLFPWSSLQDFAGESRWGKMLASDIISKQFAEGKDYTSFVRTSGAKEKMTKMK